MKKSELVFIAIKPPLDYLSLLLAAISAFSIRYIDFVQNIRPVIFDLPFKEFFGLSAIFSFWSILIFALAGLYSASGTKNAKDEIGKVFVACAAALAFVLGVMVFSRFLFDSRFIILAAWLFSFVFISIERLLIRTIQKSAYKIGFGVHRVVVIGIGNTADELTKEFETSKSLGYRVTTRFDELTPETLNQIKTLAQEDKIDEVIQVNPSANEEMTMRLVDFVNESHLDYKYAADLLGTKLSNIEILTYAGTPLVEVKKTKLDGWGKIYKRVFDIIFSTIFIILLSPIMLTVALLVKLTSKGPVLFKYKRIGQFGKSFTYFKFRSMIQNAHEVRYDPKFQEENNNLRQGSPMIKFEKDPRITPFGKFIRRWSIDELPELFLVFSGKMSLVGPRPHEVEEVKKYKTHHKRVLTIKPGITGISQVSGRSELNFEDEVKLDTYYIEDWSLLRDIQILFKTPMAVIKRRKAQ